MSKPLSKLLRQEQFAFLSRDRTDWHEHLERVRGFLGEGLMAADPTRPVLILGAGPGLEIPWELAPARTTGWDADPWSRMWTAFRHQRWPAWVFEDLTGGLAGLEAMTRRAMAEPWSGRHRDPEIAAIRLAGLLPSLHPEPRSLQTWIATHQPGTILAANVMGQFGVVAERLVERLFGAPPWLADPELADPLAEALEAWTGRAIQAFLGVLGASGADLWLVHDRAVIFGGGELELGPWADTWAGQVLGGVALEASDPLVGLDIHALLAKSHGELARRERWVWPLAPGQQHLVEALARVGSGSAV